jgi:hypothetical protein
MIKGIDFINDNDLHSDILFLMRMIRIQGLVVLNNQTQNMLF